MKLFTAIFLFTLFSTIVSVRSNVRLVESTFTPEQLNYVKVVFSFLQNQLQRAGSGLRTNPALLDNAFINSPNFQAIRVAYIKRIDQMSSQLKDIPTTGEINPNERLLYVTRRATADPDKRACTLKNYRFYSILSLESDFFGTLGQHDPSEFGSAFFGTLGQQDPSEFITMFITMRFQRDAGAYWRFKKERSGREPFLSRSYNRPKYPPFELMKALQQAPPVMGTLVLNPPSGPVALGPNNLDALPAVTFIINIPPAKKTSQAPGLPPVTESKDEGHQASGRAPRPQRRRLVT